MLNLTSSDTEGQGTEGTVCGSVAVTAYDSSSRQSEPLFGSDDMDNPLSLVPETEVCEAMFLYVLFEGEALEP